MGRRLQRSNALQPLFFTLVFSNFSKGSAICDVRSVSIGSKQIAPSSLVVRSAPLRRSAHGALMMERTTIRSRACSSAEDLVARRVLKLSDYEAIKAAITVQ
jgi:hypothetical protein